MGVPREKARSNSELGPGPGDEIVLENSSGGCRRFDQLCPLLPGETGTDPRHCEPLRDRNSGQGNWFGASSRCRGEARQDEPNCEVLPHGSFSDVGGNERSLSKPSLTFSWTSASIRVLLQARYSRRAVFPNSHTVASSPFKGTSDGRLHAPHRGERGCPATCPGGTMGPCPAHPLTAAAPGPTHRSRRDGGRAPGD